ncbi:MAG: protein kinase [Candidatus Melainabacteria bacterium]|nr:protein kinase [Candidatus Melainabacteria bacterium]
MGYNLKMDRKHASVEAENVRLRVDEESGLPDLGESFEVLDLIGHGGMGSVFRVKSKADGSILAAKVLRRELLDDRASLKRFEQEADAIARLDHPGIVNVHGRASTTQGVPYLLMDYVEGESLDSRIEKEGGLDPARTISIFEQVAEALEYAHGKGVIHRDIKPSNIILSKSETGLETAKLVDFGIARVLEGESRETCDLTATGDVFGSPAYMSPEQCLGFMLDERSDLYSLGCTIYETITGSTPFSADNPVQMVVKQIHDEPPALPSEYRGNRLSRFLNEIIFHCLEKDQKLRYQSARELKEDLAGLRQGTAKPKYRIGRGIKPTFTRRQTIGAVSLAIVLLGLFGSTRDIFSLLFSSTYSLLFVLAVTMTGVIAFAVSARDNLARIRNGLTTARQWWLTATQISLVCLGLAFLPSIIRAVIFGYAPLPYWVVELEFAAITAQMVFSVLTALLGIRYLTGSSTRQMKPASIAVQTCITVSILLPVSALLIPEQLSKLPEFLAEKCYRVRPELALSLYDLADRIHPESRFILAERALVEEWLKHYDAALADMQRLAERGQEDDYYLARHARMALEAGDLKEARHIATRLINHPRLAGDGHRLKAVCLAASGRHAEAVLQMRRSSDYNVSYVPDWSPFYEVGSLIALGMHDQAMSHLDDFARGSSSERVKSNVLKGILLDREGKHKLAESSFAAAAIMDDPSHGSRRMHWGVNDHLALAYANQRLGRPEQSRYNMDRASYFGLGKEDLAASLCMEYSGLDLSWDREQGNHKMGRMTEDSE